MPSCLACEADLIFKIERDKHRKKFCSKVCRSRFYGMVRNKFLVNKIRPCTHCGSGFKATYARQIYCSKKCQQRVATAKYMAKQEPIVGHIKRLLVRKDRQHLGLDEVLAIYHRQNGRCALSDVAMTWGSGQGRVGTHISMDKIDPAKGYALGNIQLVCRIVNMMKHDMLLDELLEWCRRIGTNHAIGLKKAA